MYVLHMAVVRGGLRHMLLLDGNICDALGECRNREGFFTKQ